MSILERVQADGSAAAADRLLADAAAAAEAARARIAAAAAELFRPPERALGQDVRIAMARLLAGLVAAVEDDLRQRLIVRLARDTPPALVATLAAGDVAVAAPILERARLLGDADLVAALLRRAEEHVLTAALPPAGNSAAPLLDSLMQSGDEPLASAAMALLVAEGRRREELDSPLFARTDLPAELQHRLVWWVAAALRRYVLSRRAVAPVALDAALVAVANEALAGYDEGDTFEGRAMQLARRLHQRLRLDDALIVCAVGDGHFALAVAALAVRARIDFASAWEMAADAGGSRLTVLLRGAGCGRSAARDVARAFACAGGGAESAAGAAEWLAGYDWLDPLAAREAIRPWQLDGGYRRALSDLAAGLVGETWA